MRNFCSTIVLSLSAAAFSVAAAPPQRVELVSELARNGSVVAEITQRLEHDGKSYRLSETWRGKGIYGLRGEAQRSSQGSIAADGLRPVKFEDQRPGRDAQKTDFDAAAKTPTAQRQDRLSFIWSFAFAPPKGPVTVTVTDSKGSTKYTYEPAGRERVKTPAGEFDTLKLVKRRDKPEDRVTEIWLAVDKGYLPVRLLLVEKDGTRMDTLASKIAAQ
ncbi:MAG: DUF3108 domain-containing protein [Candidatus Parcubacteria bacterium]|nr:DUF3108 domain-containing protein [Burkholderiales bacterium]